MSRLISYDITTTVTVDNGDGRDNGNRWLNGAAVNKRYTGRFLSL